MKYIPDIHHRRSIRLKHYDYSQAGAYFVTICTQNKEYLFGNVMHGEMILNEAGEMVKGVWHELPDRFSEIHIDEFIIMPNHIHGIISIVGAPLVGALSPRRIMPKQGQAQDLPLHWAMLWVHLNQFLHMNIPMV